MKAGVESAGGTAAILQYVIVLSHSVAYRNRSRTATESLKRFHKKSSPKCMRLRSPTTPSSHPKSCSSTMPSYSASRLVTETSPHSGRYCRHRLISRGTSDNVLFVPYRHSGMLRVKSGNPEATPANTQASSSRPGLQAEAKNPPHSLPCPHSLTTGSSLSPSVTRMHSPS